MFAENISQFFYLAFNLKTKMPFYRLDLFRARAFSHLLRAVATASAGQCCHTRGAHLDRKTRGQINSLAQLNGFRMSLFWNLECLWPVAPPPRRGKKRYLARAKGLGVPLMLE